MPRAKKVVETVQETVQDVSETVPVKRAKKVAAEPATTSTRTRAKKVTGEEGTTTTRRRRAKKDPNAPKKPLNSYMRFRADWIKNHPREFEKMNKDFKITEQGKQFGIMWKDLKAKKPTEAAKFEKAYQDEMVKFKREMEVYNAKVAAQ